MSKIYVASSWGNRLQQRIVHVLRAAKFEVYDFKNPRDGDNGFHWSEVDGGYKTWTPSQYVKALTHDLSQSGFKSDFDAMKWADMCVLVLPCGFVGAGKPLYILLDEKPEPELMYLMATKICCNVGELLEALNVPN